MSTKVLNDDGPLRVEDREDDAQMVVVHKATGLVKLVEPYEPGRITSWTLAFALARGFQMGWVARKEAEYRGERG